MDYKLNYENVKNHIIIWLDTYLTKSGLWGFVVGVSGGVDSALVSTLCAMTGAPTICVSMPYGTPVIDRAKRHLDWLCHNHPNVKVESIDLLNCYLAYKACLGDYQSELAMVNLRSRLRMVALYAISNTKNYLVAGTGNKVEDYGIMFFTLGGDGQVDLSPIGDLTKTQVKGLSNFLGISNEIIQAVPTDGLWADNRGDEDAIGATYPELEWAMDFCNKFGDINTMGEYNDVANLLNLDDRKKEVLKIYLERHEKGMHKVSPIPVCKIPHALFNTGLLEMKRR